MKLTNAVFSIVLFGLVAAPLMAQSDSRAPAEMVTAERLLERLESGDPPLILDVRTPREYRAGHIRGAINIPHSFIGSRANALARYKDRDVVIYCETGLRAQFAEWVLSEQGFKHPQTLSGHMRGWRQQNLPLVQ